MIGNILIDVIVTLKQLGEKIKIFLLLVLNLIGRLRNWWDGICRLGMQERLRIRLLLLGSIIERNYGRGFGEQDVNLNQKSLKIEGHRILSLRFNPLVKEPKSK